MATDLRELRDGLLAFSVAIGCPLEPWQAGALTLQKRTTVLVAPRQSGKSRSLAVLALWWAFRRPGQRVLVVSAGEDASRRLLAQAAAVGVASPLLVGSLVDENTGLLTLSNASEIRSVPASERAVRGWSVDLLLVDEAAQVDDELLLGACIPTTAARPDARIVLASSPGPAEGSFYEFASAGEQGSEHTASFRWSLEDAAWIEAGAIEAAREQLAPASFAREYEGHFADVGSEERVIERGWVEEAQRRELVPGDPTIFAIDVARHSGDETVCLALRDGVAHIEWAHRGADLMQTAARIVSTVRETVGPTPVVWLDAIGLGYGVLDRCRELGVAVEPFVASARAAQSERFANARAEAWWRAREALRRGEVDLDASDRVLAAQLAAVRYSLDSSGRILIADKASMKTSPDRADALVIALFARQGSMQAEAALDYLRAAKRAPRDPLWDPVLDIDLMRVKW